MSDNNSDESQSRESRTQFMAVPIPGMDGLVTTSLPHREAPAHSQHPVVLQQNTATGHESRDAQLSGLVQATPASNVNTATTQGVVVQSRGTNNFVLGVFSRGNPAVGAPSATAATTQGGVRQGNSNIGPPPATTASPPPPPPTGLPHRPRKGATTLVNVLPKTPYDETKEPAGTKHSLEYIQVQRQILEFLGARAADTLTGLLACHWTNAISLEPDPKAVEPLRLCYYMRSQGFDTYARFKDGYMELYVANPNRKYTGEPSTKVHHETDTLYWKQDTVTDEVVMRLASWSTSLSLFPGRRNALVPSQPANGTTQGLDTRSANAPRSQGGGHTTNGHTANSQQQGTQANQQQGAQPNQQQGAQPNQQQRAQPNADAVHQPTEPSLADLIAATQAAIESLLLSRNSDGAQIRALEAQLEEYKSLRDQTSNHEQT